MHSDEIYAVQSLNGVDLVGNTMPLNWLSWLRTDAGKPDVISAVILADIVYWYRPAIVRDEITGQPVGIKRRFSADKLQRNYKSLEEMFGLSRDQIRRALKRLEDAKIIDREFRTIEINNKPMSNVMYIGINPVAIKVITFYKFPENANVDPGKLLGDAFSACTRITPTGDEVFDPGLLAAIEQAEGGVGKFATTLLANFQPPSCEISNEGGVKFAKTYTKTTYTETTITDSNISHTGAGASAGGAVPQNPPHMQGFSAMWDTDDKYRQFADILRMEFPLWRNMGEIEDAAADLGNFAAKEMMDVTAIREIITELHNALKLVCLGVKPATMFDAIFTLMQKKAEPDVIIGKFQVEGWWGENFGKKRPYPSQVAANYDATFTSAANKKSSRTGGAGNTPMSTFDNFLGK
ncbi:MAG: hypothetical protein CUN56_13280, partial [Phototrophicales bacterium]